MNKCHFLGFGTLWVVALLLRDYLLQDTVGLDWLFRIRLFNMFVVPSSTARCRSLAFCYLDMNSMPDGPIRTEELFVVLRFRLNAEMGTKTAVENFLVSTENESDGGVWWRP